MSFKHVLLSASVTAVTMMALSTAHAQESRLKAFCYIDPKTQKVEGTNPDKLVEIASVSKVLATHWVVKKIGPRGRFITKVNVTPVDGDEVDVHISGGMDPLFSKNRLQFMVSELNKLGIKKVRRLTFDERFHYAESIRTGPTVASNPAGTILGPNGITASLRRSFSALGAGYNAMRASTESATGVNMQDSISLTVTTIEALKDSEFQPSADTHVFQMASSEAHVILKEMNRKSNNYIANISFRAMGSAADYRKFIKAELNMDETDLRIGNGSGYPMEVDGKRVDNLATCSAIVKVIKDLREAMALKNMRLGDVMAVAGSDSSDGASTVSRAYGNEITDDALVAKTGTADPVVALAGAASTKEGLVFFGAMVADGRPGKASSARSLIGDKVVKLFKLFGGSKEIGYIAKALSIADRQSIFKEIVAGKIKETLK